MSQIVHDDGFQSSVVHTAEDAAPNGNAFSCGIKIASLLACLLACLVIPY